MSPVFHPPVLYQEVMHFGSVVAGDVVIDSGAYNFGLACAEGEVQRK